MTSHSTAQHFLQLYKNPFFTEGLPYLDVENGILNRLGSLVLGTATTTKKTQCLEES